ncbi:MarR family winged helix-turn-helix transcriptional regulator [Methanobacterium oryzae]|uniref:MarR family winged helix-turn-helix transcriptional regulator n=1 Tax=Methanobacterium oryzae TaxID=69540 RepID=UPI003D192D40
MSEITPEILHKILIQFIRTSKKFNEFEKMSIDIGNGEKLYPSEIHIIEAIGSNRANKVTELSYMFHITKGAVSQVVNKLHDKEFIHKERNKEFGKEIILSLTPKGQKAFKIQDELHKKMKIEFSNYLDSFGLEQIDSFILILAKIEEYIDAFLNDEL